MTRASGIRLVPFFFGRGSEPRKDLGPELDAGACVIGDGRVGVRPYGPDCLSSGPTLQVSSDLLAAWAVIIPQVGSAR